MCKENLYLLVEVIKPYKGEEISSFLPPHIASKISFIPKVGDHDWIIRSLGRPIQLTLERVYDNDLSETSSIGIPEYVVYDHQLVPIHDRPGDDEILRLVGRPEETLVVE